MQSGLLRLRRRRRSASRDPQWVSVPSASERRSWTEWLTVVATVASAIAAALAVKMASRQEDATYRSIVVAHELESAAKVVEHTSALATASDALYRRLEMRGAFPKLAGTRGESSEVNQFAARDAASFAEASTNVHQLGVLLLDRSNFMLTMGLHLRTLHDENSWLAEELLDPKKVKPSIAKASPNFRRDEAVLSLDLAAFETCAHSFLENGKPLETEPFDACANSARTQYAPVYFANGSASR